jgi:hypothetical protein
METNAIGLFATGQGVLRAPREQVAASDADDARAEALMGEALGQ